LASYTINTFFKICENKLILELYSSFGKLVKDEEDYRYENYRAFAKNRFFYLKGALYNLFYLPKDFLIALMITGQFANQNLLPSETFAIGGYNTVRGYYEREINTDNGVILNFEIRSLPISFISNKQDALRFLLFLDYGYGSLHKPNIFEDNAKFLFSAGPGFRYLINPYLEARLDWGIRIKNSHIHDNDKSLLHFSVNLSY
jgi:hemolysin activation/secretion protein